MTSRVNAIERDRFEREGYLVIPGVFDDSAIARFLDRWTGLLNRNEKTDPQPTAGTILSGAAGGVYGVRNVLTIWPDVIPLSFQSALGTIVCEILGSEARVVRGLLFDKPPGQSWALPMHRDLTIAVKKHGPIGVFSKPTIKAGVPHVEAPAELLDRMVTVRIHLDDMTDENGPLKLIPGTHRGGDSGETVTILGRAGDVLLMRPRILHGSGQSAIGTDRHRRIIHLECAPSADLPDGYEWFDSRPIGSSAESMD
ncbi:MAG: phytanoyl-CoA dioxygenase family protein [Gemmataceae bacterium]